MAGGDPSFIKEMIDIFKAQIEEYKVEMPELLSKKEYVLLSKLAHKAKSSVAVMGMTKEADILKDLETKAKESIDTSSYEEMINLVLSNSELAVKELESSLNK